MARYLDGISARANPVQLLFGADALEVQRPDGTTVAWPWRSLRWADRPLRRIGSSLHPDARLELDPDEVARLEALVPALSEQVTRRAHTQLVAKLAAAGMSLAALIFFGIPAASRPLATITPHAFERQLGAAVESQLRLAVRFCDALPPGSTVLQGLVGRIAWHADYPGPISVRVVNTEVINAFALPGGRVWVTKGLIDAVGTPDELAAVLAHEIAHIENRDMLAGVYRAVGFGLLLDAVISGGSGAGQQLVLLGANLTDMHYSRGVEELADRRAMELLAAAGIDSRGMPAFFERLQDLEDAAGLPGWAEFVASHPDTGARAEITRALARPGAPALSSVDWRAVQASCISIPARPPGPTPSLPNPTRLPTRLIE